MIDIEGVLLILIDGVLDIEIEGVAETPGVLLTDIEGVIDGVTEGVLLILIDGVGEGEGETGTAHGTNHEQIVGDVTLSPLNPIVASS